VSNIFSEMFFYGISLTLSFFHPWDKIIVTRGQQPDSLYVL